MNLGNKAEIGIIDNDKGIGFAQNNKVKEFWFTKCKAKDFRKR